MSKFSLLFIFFLVIILDQFSKYLARQFDLVTINQGLSFGLIDQSPVIIHGILFVITISLLYVLLQDVWQKHVWSFVAIVASGFSNFLDRLLWGGVQDFLPVPFFNIRNNLADWMIVGVLVFILTEMVKMKPSIRGKLDS